MLEITQHGYAGAAPELRYTPSGKPVVTFRVGTSSRWHDDNDKPKERTDWVQWEIWGPQAENLAKFVKKGSQVLVRGSIRNHSWEKDGVTHYRDRHVVNFWRLLDRKPQDSSASVPEGNTAGAPPEEDDIPF